MDPIGMTSNFSIKLGYFLLLAIKYCDEDFAATAKDYNYYYC